MLQWLMEILESGEHALQVVGVGGQTQTVLAHSFIDALIAKYQEHEPMPVPVTEFAAPVEPSNPVPTDEQIAAYLARQAESTANVRTSTVVDAATGAPQGTFQATA
jgi:hypothetical protein